MFSFCLCFELIKEAHKSINLFCIYFPGVTVSTLMPLSRGRSENRVSLSLNVLLVVIKKIRKNIKFQFSGPLIDEGLQLKFSCSPVPSILSSLPRKDVCSFPKNSLVRFYLLVCFFFSLFLTKYCLTATNVSISISANTSILLS